MFWWTSFTTGLKFSVFNERSGFARQRGEDISLVVIDANVSCDTDEVLSFLGRVAFVPSIGNQTWKSNSF